MSSVWAIIMTVPRFSGHEAVLGRYISDILLQQHSPCLAQFSLLTPKYVPFLGDRGTELPPIITTSSRYNKHFPEARAVITSPLMMAYIIEAVSEDDAEHVYCAHCTQSRVQFCCEESRAATMRTAMIARYESPPFIAAAPPN